MSCHRTVPQGSPCPATAVRAALKLAKWALAGPDWPSVGPAVAEVVRSAGGGGGTYVGTPEAAVEALLAAAAKGAPAHAKAWRALGDRCYLQAQAVGLDATGCLISMQLTKCANEQQQPLFLPRMNSLRCCCCYICALCN